MRPKFLLFTFFITLLSVQAQITMERSDLLVGIGDTTYYQRVLEPTSYSFPSEGPDQVWDYSNIQTNTNYVTSIHSAGSSVDVPTANIIYTGSSLSSLQSLSVTYEYNWFERLDEHGHATVARELLPNHIPLVSLTGNTSDSLNHTGTLKIYEEPFYRVKFPLNYGDSWTNNFLLESDYILNLPAFGINQTPGQRLGAIEADAEVVGWGTLILPDPTSDQNYELEALLVKYQELATTSWHLAGAPAPTPLLDAFGLTQDAEYNETTYRFWVKGLPRQALTIFGDQSVQSISIIKDIDQHITSTQELEALRQAFKTYPNPLKAGAILSFETTASFTNATIDFFDNQGRLAYKTNYAPSIQLPSHLNTGMYYYKIKDENNRPIGLGQIVIE